MILQEAEATGQGHVALYNIKQVFRSRFHGHVFLHPALWPRNDYIRNPYSEFEFVYQEK